MLGFKKHTHTQATVAGFRLNLRVLGLSGVAAMGAWPEPEGRASEAQMDSLACCPVVTRGQQPGQRWVLSVVLGSSRKGPCCVASLIFGRVRLARKVLLRLEEGQHKTCHVKQ